MRPDNEPGCTILCFLPALSGALIPVVSFLLLCTLPLYSQNTSRPLHFERIGTKEGLSSLSLYKVKQDSKGFLWIGTVNGLNRYDGVGFKVFKSDPFVPEGFAQNKILEISEDKSGGIWAISEDKSLFRLDAQTETFRQVKLLPGAEDGGEPPAVLCMLQDRYGTYWVGTKEQGLNRLDPATGQLTQVPLPGISAGGHPGAILNLAEDQRGNLWVGGAKLFFLALEPGSGKVQEVKTFPQVKIDYIRCMIVDRNGQIWMGGNAPELTRFNPVTGDVRLYRYLPQALTHSADINADRVNTLFEDRQGWIWAGSNNEGISLIHPATAEVQQVLYDRYDSQSLSNNTVVSISEDNAGVIWISTWGGGLNKYDPKAARFGHFASIPANENSLSNPSVTCFLKGGNSNVWVGTSDGLNHIDLTTGKASRFFSSRSRAGRQESYIYAIASSGPNCPLPNQGLWVATLHGLLTLDPVSGRLSKWQSPGGAGKPLESDIVYFLTKDRKGVLWAVTLPYRLFRFDTATGTFQLFDLIDQTNSAFDPNVVADQQQNIWVGTKDKGLFKLDLNTQQTTRFENCPDEKSALPAIQITCFLKDRRGRQWIGAYTGLYQLLNVSEKGTACYRRYTEQDGLSNMAVMGILEDDHGQLWISTGEGLSRFNPETRVFRNYGRQDGLQDDEFNYGAFFKHSGTGEMYFGGINGFNIFHPDSIRDDSTMPPVVITRIEVSGGSGSGMKPVLADSPARPGALPSIHLEFREKVLTFHFAALHLAAPDKNQFAFQLEEFDQEWRLVGNRHEVTYTNLDPGRYIFRVKASNKDGVWNEQGVALKVIVSPPWWTSWWAWLFYLLLFAAAVYSVHRFQTARVHDRAEAARLKELNESKSAFLSTVSHELRTPLTSILGFSKIIKKRMEERIIPVLPLDDPKMERTVEQVNGNLDIVITESERLTVLINEVLDLAKIEAGKSVWNEDQVVMSEIIEHAIASTEALLNQKQLILQQRVEPGLPVIIADRDRLIQVVVNLLSNAIKFTETGSIIVAAVRQGQEIIVSVKDTGIGISGKDQRLMFEKFKQAGDDTLTGKPKGTGLGLSISKEIIEHYGGRIWAESEPGKGSTFSFALPL